MNRLFANVSPLILAAFAVVLLSGCVVEDELEEIELEQRGSVNLIGFDVWLEIGDIERGKRVEDVRIEENDNLLASDNAMDIGDTLDFTYRDKAYRLHVVDLIDRSPTFNDPFSDDLGFFGLERL